MAQENGGTTDIKRPGNKQKKETSDLYRKSAPPIRYSTGTTSGIKLWNPQGGDTPTHAIVKETRNLPQMWASLATVADLEIEDEDDVLMEMPSDLRRMRHLRQLRLAWSCIHRLPEWISTLNIKFLSLRDNKLRDVSSLSGMRHLVCLDMVNNQVVELPEQIGELTKLQILCVSGNHLNKLPDSLGQMSELRTIQCNSNKLKALPESLGNLQQLINLDVSFNRLQAIPDSIGGLTSLVELRATSNCLQELPPSISNVRHLRHLFLAKNTFTKVPPTLGTLPELTTLNMRENAITEMYCKLSVRALLLDQNQLKEIPNSVCECTHLQVLSLRKNAITDIPPAVAKLKNIKAIYLDENTKLTRVPDEICVLPELRHLSVKDTDINSLPTHFDSLQRLSYLDLPTSNLTPALREAYSDGIPAVMQYIRETRENEPEDYYANTDFGDEIYENC